MYKWKMLFVGLFCLFVVIIKAEVSAADNGLTEEKLTPKGRDLEARYAKELNSLRNQILTAMPFAGQKELKAYLKACDDQANAINELKAAEEKLLVIDKSRKLVEHAKKKWIGGAEKGIAKAEKMLKDAKTDPERKSAKNELAKCKNNLKEGIAALKERQENLKKALIEEPAMLKAVEAAESKLTKARVDILKALKKLGSDKFLPAEKLDDYFFACAKEKALEKKLQTARENMSKINKARGLVRHAKDKWIRDAEKGIAKTKVKLNNAKTDEERQAAQKELANWQNNREEGLEALKERQAALDAVMVDEPKLKKDLELAKEALKNAQRNTLENFEQLGLSTVLKSDKLDSKLVKFAVLNEATPKGLAAFAQQGKKQEQLVESLLLDTDLMKEMLIADGARGGKYGRAMEIYTDIQKASPKAKDGALQRLALAVSLQHAVPTNQRNPNNATDAPVAVDPIKRYLSYEKAFLAGELDPAFKDFSTWEYRMVIYGQEPDEISDWGRQMLRNYRPDHIANPDYRWRYMASVRTDIPYCHGYEKNDRPDLQFYQNILMNGGVCGRRAFFGRFMLRAFGIPTTARPQPGHAALAHWTPSGWVVCLGAGWGGGWTKTIYKKDLDFLATTQARESNEDFIEVKRAQWIGDIFGEEKIYGLHSDEPGFWYRASLDKQRSIIKEAKTIAAVGEELGEANESKVKYNEVTADPTDEDRKILVSADGRITIPAVACSKPTKSTKKILFMSSNLGGKQLHYNRVGKPETFEYKFEVPKAGIYNLTAKIVTPSKDQTLFVSVNGSENTIEMKLPFTVGMWDECKPVKVKLEKGKNILKFSREGKNVKGLTIKEFNLTPVP